VSAEANADSKPLWIDYFRMSMHTGFNVWSMLSDSHGNTQRKTNSLNDVVNLYKDNPDLKDMVQP